MNEKLLNNFCSKCGLFDCPDSQTFDLLEPLPEIALGFDNLLEFFRCILSPLNTKTSLTPSEIQNIVNDLNLSVKYLNSLKKSLKKYMESEKKDK